MLENFIQYVRDFHNNNEQGLQFINLVLSEHIKDNPVNQTEVEHILDFLYHNKVKDVSKISYQHFIDKTKKWDKKLQSIKLKDDSDGIETILNLDNGFKFVKLISKESYEKEGKLMSHCVSSYYGKSESIIYSLRDKNNNPHCTIEQTNNETDVTQIKGKGNGDIHPDYIGYVITFLEHLGNTIRESEMRYLGYISCEGLYEYMDDESKKYVYNEKWIKKDYVPSLKDGKNIFDIIQEKGLITLQDDIPKQNFKPGFFNIGLSLVKPSTTGDYARSSTTGNYAHSSTTGDSTHSSTTGDSTHSSTTGDSTHSSTTGEFAHSITTGNYAHSSTTGNYAHSSTTGYSAHSSTTGYNAHSSTTGYNAHSSTTGDSTHSSTTGNYAHSSTTGDYARSSTTGYSAHSSTTGYNAHSSTTGDYARSSTTGNYAHSSTTGDYANSSTTGNYAHSSTTGDYANSSTTGNYAHSSTTGKNSIACSLGISGKAKASLGEWIVLVEWKEKKDNSMYIKCVKTAKIDGKKLLPDTFYKLEGGKFIIA